MKFKKINDIRELYNFNYFFFVKKKRIQNTLMVDGTNSANF